MSTSLPIKVLGYSGVTQTLALYDTGPFDNDSTIGIESDYIRIPLHKIVLNSELVSRSVVLAIMPTLPIDGVSLLLYGMR